MTVGGETVQVKVLGRLVVTDAAGTGLPADDLPRRARQVLGVLAARYDRMQSKDSLADAVWGEELPGNHVAALEHYVSVIRRRLQPGVPASASFIVTRAGGYLFDTARAGLDLADLRRLVRSLDGNPPGSPARLALYQQILDLAADLPFPEDEYADWASPPRAEVRAAALGALLGLAEAARTEDPTRALRLAQEAMELDGYVEQSYRLAMMASVALGRPDEALRWFERCREVLDRELGVAPSPET
ncbi:MAG TPA: BTAD domain-containing putative transcriptional regulator, partial [Catenuloplanes sp.]